MENKRLRKIAILTTLSSMLLTGCSNKIENKETLEPIPIIQDSTKEVENNEDEVILNKTIEEIYENYKEKSNKNVEISDLLIEKFDNPKYIWNTEGENYIYDYKINNADNPGYIYIDPGYHGKMYAVIVKNNENDYEPIAALADIDNKIINVKVTYYYDNNRYEPSDNYIIINNPKKEDFDNIKNGNDYINNICQTNEDIKLQLKDN